ncbi:MAG: hypothetical protein IIC36_12025 [Gemmatimonadetes bacterium]|nr:hypothetical protein [Gemmatimonadota bacterium]
MMSPHPKRWLNAHPLLLLLFTATLIGGTARTVEAQVESRKSPGVAFALSFFVTGTGQAYNKQWGKGGLMLGGQLVSFGVLLSDNCGFLYTTNNCGWLTTAGLVGIAGFWVWSVIDAPLAAKGINRRIDAGQMALEIGPQLIVPQSRSAMGGLRSAGLPSLHRDWRIDLSLVRVRF